MNWALILNSLLVSALATVCSVVCGLAAALWLAGLPQVWRTRWLAASVLALSLPPFLVTNCWLHYLGHTGAWRGWLPFDIYSMGGAVWVLALMTWPISLLATLGAWRQLEPAQLESDAAVSGAALLRGLLLPLARGALVQGAVLTFVLALNNFAVPAILQVKVFPAEVWVQFNTTFDSAAALATSWPMIVVPLLLLCWLRRRQTPWPQVDGTVPAQLFRRQLGAGWHSACGVFTVALVLLAAVLPIAQLLTSNLTWSELPKAVAAGQSALWNSVFFAAVTATICVLAGLAGWRLPVGIFLWLPFLIPGVLMGIGLIFAFNRPWCAALYQHAGIVILAMGIRYLGFGWNGAAHALRGTDRDLTDAARLEGASAWQRLRHVHWPRLAPQLAAVWYIIFLLCLWDVESIVLIVPPGGETLALRVFNLLHYGHNKQVDALCLALLAVAVAPLLLWRAWAWLGESRRGLALLPLAAAIFLAGCSPPATERALEGKFFSRAVVFGTRGGGAGEFNKPRSVALDRQDNFYVVDMSGRVQKFAPDGHLLLSWRMHADETGKPKGEPKGMGTDREGNIIVVEPHYQRFSRFTPEGKQIERWGEKGTNEGQFIMPRAVAVNSKGNFLFPEYTEVDRVQEFSSPDRKLVRVIGHSGEGPGEFSRPEGICVDAQDRIYVADSCNHRIQIFSPDGKWLASYGKAGSGLGELSYPYDICVDKAGRQYVCEFGNSRIQVFGVHNEPLEIIGRAGGAPGEFSNPWSIALDSHENLFVADSQNHRVQKLVRR